MKKVKIHNKILEEAKEREKRWKELRGFMEKYQEPKPTQKEVTKTKEKIETKANKENEVDIFLKNLGLEKYSELMREHGIDDIETLTELSELHLEQLGIVLGHRIKLLKKIKEMNTEPEEQKISITSNGVSPNSKSTSYNNRDSQETNTLVKPAKDFSLDPKSTNITQTRPIEPILKKPSSKSQSTETGMAISSSREELNQYIPKSTKLTGEHIGISVNTYAARDAKAPLYPAKQERNIESHHTDPPRNKSPIISLQKAPISNKPITVGKSLATYQPTSQESEKTMKLNEIIENKCENQANEEIKWDHFTYLPYKPSEEIQASIINKPNSRPHSANMKTENKSVEKSTHKFTEKSATHRGDKFEVVGWDS